MHQKIIGLIILILINSNYCTYSDCEDEEDQTKCSEHDIEYEGFSCYKIKILNNPEKNEEAETSCMPFPNDKNIQQSYNKFYSGFFKEIISIYGEYYWSDEDEDEDNGRQCGSKMDKDGYSMNDEIVISPVECTEEDTKLYTSNNTCLHLFYGRYFYSMFEQNMENYVEYQSITDKNACFNAEKFPELKDLIDCGYAEIKYIEGTKEKKINTCYLIPNDKMPQELMKYYKEFVGPFEEGLLTIIFGIEKETEIEKFQITVENKNGKKVEYIPGKSEIKILSEGSEPNQSNLSNQYIFLKFNIILLSLILLGF